jgi:hypothetical protein
VTDCTSCGHTTTSGTGGGHRDASAPDVVAEGAADEAGDEHRTSVTVMFDVGRTNDTGFRLVSPYDAAVRVSAVGAAGTLVTTGDTGVPPSGSLDGVATGPNWFAVEDPTGTSRILPTLQPVMVDPVTPLAGLVCIGASQLTPLVVDGEPWAPLKGHATLIVIFDRGGKLSSGVTIGPTLPAGASIAYEQAGAYATPMNNPDIATDDEGTVIVRDIASVATYPATTTLELTYHLGASTLTFDTNLAADFVTWMTVPIP